MISVGLIDKIAEMFCLKHEQVLEFFIVKVKHALALQLRNNEKLKSAH